MMLTRLDERPWLLFLVSLLLTMAASGGAGVLTVEVLGPWTEYGAHAAIVVAGVVAGLVTSRLAGWLTSTDVENRVRPARRPLVEWTHLKLVTMESSVSGRRNFATLVPSLARREILRIIFMRWATAILIPERLFIKAMRLSLGWKAVTVVAPLVVFSAGAAWAGASAPPTDPLWRSLAIVAFTIGVSAFFAYLAFLSKMVLEHSREIGRLQAMEEAIVENLTSLGEKVDHLAVEVRHLPTTRQPPPGN